MTTQEIREKLYRNTIIKLCTALEELMEDAGGEPRKRDPDSKATWRKCQKALDAAKTYRT